MSLNDEFEEVKRGFLAQAPEDAIKIIGEESESLINSGIGERALSNGDMAPHFSLDNASGRRVDSTALLSRGSLVISFYRGAWCPYCNLELRAFQKVFKEIEALGANFVAISPNLPDTSLTSIEKHSLEYEVLSDRGCNVASEFGLVFTLPHSLRSIYAGFGIDIPGENGEESFLLPIPATYVLNREGRIIFSYVNADYTRRGEPQDVLKALRA